MSNIRTYEITHSKQKLLSIKQKETTDYLLGGSLVMENGKLDKYLFEGGYAQATAATKTTDNFAFNYYNKDHLGNNREVVDASGAVTQVTNYYPFGAPYADASASKGSDVQPYKYNGKELDLMHGLNTYDYGARQHDPILARWDRINPLCEKYYSTSPYAYCMNNPVRFIDPDGKKIQLCGKGAAELLQHINSLSKTQYTIDAKGFLTATSITVDRNSSKYSEWLDKGIKEDNNVMVHIGKSVKNEKGELESIDNYGGGATTSESEGNDITRINVVIGDDNGGKDKYNVMGVNGRMETTMALTLMHELVGHAVPKLLLLNDSKRQEGNAIANDNEVREELKNNGHKNVEARKEDDKHGEYKDH